MGQCENTADMLLIMHGPNVEFASGGTSLCDFDSNFDPILGNSFFSLALDLVDLNSDMLHEMLGNTPKGYMGGMGKYDFHFGHSG